MFHPEQSVHRRNTAGGMFMHREERPIVSEQDRMNSIAAAAISKSGGMPVHRVYQNVKQINDVVIPLQASKPTVGIRAQKQFGMRALFM